MRHRNGGKGPRAGVGRRPGPTAVPPIPAQPVPGAAALTRSNVSTPLGSAAPSAYQSEAETDVSESITALTQNIADLTMDVPLDNPDAFAPKKKPKKPFPFFEMPSELRLRVYAYHFGNVDEVLDLEANNYKRIYLKLAILRTCRQVYTEASHFFYSTHIVRIFPIYGKFIRTKKPLLARLKPGQRASLTTLELRLGPGWGRPPRTWVVNPALGLDHCTEVRRVRVFVECDPSHDIFKGFRHSDGFYEAFCRTLLDDVLAGLPGCDVVEFDANPSVKKSGAMMRGLLEVAQSRGLRLAWGPEKGWDDGDEAEEEVKVPNHSPIGRGTAVFNSAIAQGISATNGHGFVQAAHGHHGVMVLA